LREVHIARWEELDNNPATRHIAAADGNLYQLHSTGAIFRYVGPPLTGWELLDDNPATSQIAGADDRLYQIHHSGAIWRYVAPPPTPRVAYGTDLARMRADGRLGS
jgi:hypothetical protein